MPIPSTADQVAELPPFAGDPNLACRSGNPDWWFADGTKDPHSRSWVEKAKRLCRGCPKRWECLDWAIRTRQTFGIYGGETAKGRRNMQRRGREH